MIRSEVEHNIPQITKLYPYLGICRDIDDSEKYTIVLFTSSNAGVVVADKNGNEAVGSYCNGWAEAIFERYDGVVTLSNWEVVR